MSNDKQSSESWNVDGDAEKNVFERNTAPIIKDISGAEININITQPAIPIKVKQGREIKKISLSVTASLRTSGELNTEDINNILDSAENHIRQMISSLMDPEELSTQKKYSKK